MGNRMVFWMTAVLAGSGVTQEITVRDPSQRISHDASLVALREALETLEGSARVRAIRALGQRRDKDASGPLAVLVGNRDSATVEAALTALGQIASPEAADVLTRVAPSGASRAVLHDAQLCCAERLAGNGNVVQAAKLYRLIWSSDRAMAWRLSGLAGLVRINSERATPMLLQALESKDPFCRAMAARLARPFRDRPVATALLQRLAEQDAARPLLLKHSNVVDQAPCAADLPLLGVLSPHDSYPTLIKRMNTRVTTNRSATEPPLPLPKHDITHYGARAGIAQDNAPFIQKALDAAGKRGGGTVFIPAGTFYSSKILLKSNTTLFLAKGAVLKAVANIDAYEADERHLVVARDARHVALVGQGTIDGNGFAFWQPKTKPHQWLRPLPRRVSPLVFFDTCSDVLVEGIRLMASPGWTLKIGNSDRAHVLNVDIDNYLYGPNTDGIDICDSRDVQVFGCRVQTGDDAVVIKAYNRSCERILVSHCLLRSHCAAFKLGTSSSSDFRHIQFRDSIVHQSNRIVGLYSRDGGTMEDISVYNISADTNCGMRLSRPIHIDLCKRNAQSKVGTIRHVVFCNMRISTEGRILMTNADGGRIENVRLRDIELRYPLIVTPDEHMKNARSGQFSTRSPRARVAPAAIVAEGIKDLCVQDVVIHWPGEELSADWLLRGPLSPDIPSSGKPYYRVQRANEPFHVFWGSHLLGGALDLPLSAPFGKVDKYLLTKSTINVVR